MQLNTIPGGQRMFAIDLAGLTKQVVRNKNTGQSFWVRGFTQGNLELVPIQGEDILIPEKSFNLESWEIIH